MLPKGAPSRFLQPQAVGLPIEPKTGRSSPTSRSSISTRTAWPTSSPATCCANRVVWLRQAPRGTSPKRRSAPRSARPAHAEAVDIDRDGDLDLLVASLGVMFPSNARIGSVVVLENDGRGRFTNRVLADQIARVADVRAGDLDGDGDLDLAVAGFGYDDGETRGWRIWATGGSRARAAESVRGRSTWRSPISTATAISTSRRSSARSGKRSTRSSTTGAAASSRR